MPLANPTSVTISRLHAVPRGGFYMHPETGFTVRGPSYFTIHGVVSWTNAETAAHLVELKAMGQTITLPKGSSRAYVQFGQTEASSKPNYFNPLTGSASASVSVQLRGQSGDSSVVSASTTVDMTAVPEFSGSLNFGTSLEIPSWTGVPWNPTFQILDETGNAVFNGVGSVNGNANISGNENGAFSLVAGKTYKAVLTMGDRFKANVQVINDPNPTVIGNVRVIGLPPRVWKFGYYTAISTKSQTLFFSPDPLLNSFSAVSEAVKVLRGTKVRILLRASHAATWAINSGAPAGLTITARSGVAGTDYYLEAASLATGNYSISLTATRVSDSTTANATISLGVVSSESAGDKIQIITNPSWQNNGLSYVVGNSVSVAMTSNPTAGVIWSASGLPAGLEIEQSTGLISGRLTTAGRFLASIVASPASGNLLEPSLPAVITFTVRQAALPPGGGTGGSGETNNQAIVRIPWVLSEWTLTDLQVLARTREVQSTLLVQPTTLTQNNSSTPQPDKSSMRIKVGDNVNFAVFFIGADDRPFELAPDRLRVTIRPVNNFDDSLVFESDTSPTAITTEMDPYYLLAVSTAGRQRQIVQEWVEDSGKNEPLSCVADIDWTKNGQNFSSASFPVLLELDVTRP